MNKHYDYERAIKLWLRYFNNTNTKLTPTKFYQMLEQSPYADTIIHHDSLYVKPRLGFEVWIKSLQGD